MDRVVQEQCVPRRLARASLEARTALTSGRAGAGRWPERGEGLRGQAQVLEDGPGDGEAKDDSDDAG
jgi:hypothetical protein